MKEHYIKAVVELIEGGQNIDQVLVNLEAALMRKGHQNLRLAILEGVVSELEQIVTNNTSTITLAKDVDETKFKSAVEASLQAIGGEIKTAKLKIDPSLTGGYIASHQGKTIDASYKTKLLKLYRTITT